MSFSVGIIGLPNVGKSTLFQQLTKKRVAVGPYPFTTLHPNIGVVQVPDARLEKIAEIIKPEKITQTIIEFIDIAGLIKDAYKGEGLGNQFLAQVRNCHALLQVVRAFENEGVENMLGQINPEKEIEIVKTELLMKDLETLEALISKIEKNVKKDKKALKKFDLLKKVKEAVSQGKLISEIKLTDEEKLELKEYQLLTQKPILYLLNGYNLKKQNLVKFKNGWLGINLKEEEECSKLPVKEAKELGFQSQLDQLIISCYNILDLITFYTVAGGKEVRAWTLKKGQKAPDAGGVVHADFKEKFIRAEVINWRKLVESNSWAEAKKRGLIKIAGKDYIMQDGDVIEFKI
jgi:hypothetical protein